jgi:hypothetical protein
MILDYEGDKMSGKRIGSFRSGDRSEYIAAFGLSRVAFIDPVPRQEDFGVLDFVCILASEVGKHVYPESAFFVQVKSNTNPIIFDRDAVRWITHHMDQPLLICVADKAATQLTLYSCARIWMALFCRPEATELTLLLEGDPPSSNPKVSDDPAGARLQLHLGPPILSMTLSELEANSAAAYDVLRPWLQLDAQNIARRRIGRIAASCFSAWITNVPPTSPYENRYFMGPNFHPAEHELAPVLTALAHNYRRSGNKTKCDALSAFLNTIKEHLDSHGLDFAEGRNVVS